MNIKSKMILKEKISRVFTDSVFKLPLFYQYPGGLRLKLSEGGSFLNQFITAHKKGMEICNSVFRESNDITICLRIFGGKSILSTLPTLRSLKDADIYPTSDKEYWTEFDEEWHGDDYYSDCLWHYIAFKLPAEFLTNALWCACATDFGVIKPNPGARIYLFDFQQKIVVLPYDDRGMDIVGPNKQLLKDLYDNFSNDLLEYDRAEMDAVFG